MINTKQLKSAITLFILLYPLQAFASNYMPIFVGLLVVGLLSIVIHLTSFMRLIGNKINKKYCVTSFLLFAFIFWGSILSLDYISQTFSFAQVFLKNYFGIFLLVLFAVYIVPVLISIKCSNKTIHKENVSYIDQSVLEHNKSLKPGTPQNGAP